MEILAAQRVSMLAKQSVRSRIWAQLTVVDKFRIPHFDGVDSFNDIGRNDVVITDGMRHSRDAPRAPHVVTPTQDVAIVEPAIDA